MNETLAMELSRKHIWSASWHAQKSRFVLANIPVNSPVCLLAFAFAQLVTV